MYRVNERAPRSTEHVVIDVGPTPTPRGRPDPTKPPWTSTADKIAKAEARLAAARWVKRVLEQAAEEAPVARTTASPPTEDLLAKRPGLLDAAPPNRPSSEEMAWRLRMMRTAK